MKANVKAVIVIDDKEIGEFSADVEIPNDDEKNNEEFDKSFEDILKIKILEDETFKQFVTYAITDSYDENSGMTPSEAVDNFWEKRFKLRISF